jgi:acetyl/propionyl-CoA carboxylase alpha subunit
MKKLELFLDGENFKGQAEKIQGILWVHLNGNTFTFDPRQKQNGLSSSSEKFGEIIAPVPGIITKVNVEEGEEVPAHETMVVMEAMKMEYLLKAPESIQVSKIACREGDKVGVGQMLIAWVWRKQMGLFLPEPGMA